MLLLSLSSGLFLVRLLDTGGVGVDVDVDDVVSNDVTSFLYLCGV